MDLTDLNAGSSQQTSFVPTPRLEDIAVKLTDPVTEGPPDIIPGLLPREGQLVIAGETNVGKSLMALEIASCLASGEALWGDIRPTLKAKRILYVLGEHYVGVIQRLLAVTRLPMPDTAYILGPEQLGFDKWLVGNGKPNLHAIGKFKKWAEGVDLIVWDPLSSFTCGIDSENDNIGMRLVLDMMSLVSQSSGASSLILAHQGKPMLDKFGNEHGRRTYAIRGASAIEDAATNIFYMQRGTEAPLKQAVGSMDGQIIELILRKYKGEAPERYRLLRDPLTLTHTLLGNKPFQEVQKIATMAKVHRLQAANPQMDFRTCVKLVAQLEGVAPETIERHLGLR